MLPVIISFYAFTVVLAWFLIRKDTPCEHEFEPRGCRKVRGLESTDDIEDRCAQCAYVCDLESWLLGFIWPIYLTGVLLFKAFRRK